MTFPSTLLPSLVVATTAAAWGAWWIPLRGIDDAGLTGQWSTFAVYAVGTVVMLPVANFRFAHFVAGGWRLIAVGGFFAGMLASWSYGLIIGDVVRVTLLFYLAPIWGTLLAIFVLREKLNFLRTISILLGMTGAATVLGVEGGLPIPRSGGDWMGLAAGVSFALSAMFAHKSPEIGGFEKTFVAFFLAAVLTLAITAIAPPGTAAAPDDVMNALPLLVAATILWLIPITWACLWAAARLDPGRISILLMMEVVSAAVTATALTDEPFGWRGLIGCVLIIAAGTLEAIDQMRRPARTPS